MEQVVHIYGNLQGFCTMDISQLMYNKIRPSGMCNLELCNMVNYLLEQTTASNFRTEEEFLQNEVAGHSETSMSTSHTVHYYISEYHSFNIHSCEILKSITLCNVNCSCIRGIYGYSDLRCSETLPRLCEMS
jgi:hypothetical protein